MRLNTDDKLRQGELYRCEGALGLFSYADAHEGRRTKPFLAAIWRGEKRPPKAGEWYFSGSPICAYQTKGDLSYPHHIAHVVQVIPKITYEVQELEEQP